MPLPGKILAKVSDTQTVEHSSSKSIFDAGKNSGTNLGQAVTFLPDITSLNNKIKFH